MSDHPTPWIALRQHRERARLSYTQLSELTGYSRQFLACLESGDRKYNTTHVEVIAAALSINADDLATDAPPPVRRRKASAAVGVGPHVVAQLRAEHQQLGQRIDRLEDHFGLSETAGAA